MIVVGLLIPCIPVILAHTKGGYTISGFPNIQCFPKEVAVSYYGVTLPISILTGVGITLVIFMFRTIILLIRSQAHRKDNLSMEVSKREVCMIYSMICSLCVLK